MIPDVSFSFAAPLPQAPPLSPYGTFQGELFLYGGNRVAFESPLPQPPQVQVVQQQQNQQQDREKSNISKSSTKNNKCLLIGGLSDGLLPTPYTQALQDACIEKQWSLVQPLTSSSYTGFGHGSLDRDVQELCECLRYCIAHRNAQDFAIVGHSTGTQDAIHLLQFLYQETVAAEAATTTSTTTMTKFPNTVAADLLYRIRLVVLQAPVSDRQASLLEKGQDEYEHWLRHAQQMVVAMQGDEMMPRRAFWAPITAQRYLDLNQRNGRDDYFSSDFSHDEWVQRLGHVRKIHDWQLLQRQQLSNNDNPDHDPPPLRVLVVCSGSDEYVPTDIDSEDLMQRLVYAMNGGDDATKSTTGPAAAAAAMGLHLPTANHNLSQGPGDMELFVQRIQELLY